jgi:16S rRNA (cytosine1402-N4)-methyltransferase
MTDPERQRPARRPRYRGKNPRHFHEKYKEHQPDRYPEEIARVLAGGRTPAGTHRPIMVREILAVLSPRPGEVAVDCTLGHGGHARELLTAIQPGGRLLGIDADPVELSRTEARLRTLGFPDDALIVRRMNFAGVPRFLAEFAPEGADVMLADLGVSSMQLDDPVRGFTFKIDGPLDMRMDPSRGRTVSDWLSTQNETGLARIFTANSDEPHAAELAAAILRAHARGPITTTLSLAAVVRQTARAFSRSSQSADTAVRRVFQALRIAVNDEFNSLSALLRCVPSCLKPGGRVAILSFHSGEDRLVKSAFKSGFHDGTYSSIATEVMRAGADEKRANPRSSAAKLRFAIRASQSI